VIYRITESDVLNFLRTQTRTTKEVYAYFHSSPYRANKKQVDALLQLLLRTGKIVLLGDGIIKVVYVEPGVMSG
jgi:hypothetical protein